MNRPLIAITLCLVVIIAQPASVRAQADGAVDKERSTRQQLDLKPVKLIYQHVEGTSLKSPRGIFVDRKRSEIYVADTMNDLVAVYDSDGLPLFAFGFNGEIKEPFRVVSDPRGRIYVIAGSPRSVKLFNYRGEYQRDFPFTALETAPDPTAIAVDSLGNLYIGDAAGSRVLVYDSEYRLKLAIRAQGGEKARLQSVQGIALDDRGNVYVADARATPAIQVFSPQGKFLRGWGEHQTGPQNFSLPAGLAIDAEGRVIAVDTLRHAIVVFTAQGEFVGRYGGKGTQPGAVAYPTDIAADDAGRIYVVERVGSRLQIFQERLVSTRGRDARNSANPFRETIRSQLSEFIKTMR